MDCCAKPLDLGSFDKHPDERLYVELDFSATLETRWRPGKLYRTGDTVRPGNGFAYRATGDFTSGSREPRWSTALDISTRDGSGEWQTIKANFEGVDVINQAAVTLPFGLIVDGAVTWEGSSLTVPIAAGIDGLQYECFVEIGTIGGQILVGLFACGVSSKRRCD